MNQNIFNRGVPFGKETLWLYASDDPFYSLDTTRSYFAAFEDAGGTGVFVDEFPDEIGHNLYSVPEYWGSVVDNYLDRLGLPHEPAPSVIRWTPDPSLPPAAFLGQWNGWWGSPGAGTYTSLSISSVAADGYPSGTYVFDTTTSSIRPLGPIDDGVLRLRRRSNATIEFFVAREDVLIGTFRRPKTANQPYAFSRAILARVGD